MEIVKIILEFIIAIEIGLILYDMRLSEKQMDEIAEEVKRDLEGEHISRREIHGTFQNPLADSYRKNTRGQYVPIQPNSKMLDGDDDE